MLQKLASDSFILSEHFLLILLFLQRTWSYRTQLRLRPQGTVGHKGYKSDTNYSSWAEMISVGQNNPGDLGWFGQKGPKLGINDPSWFFFDLDHVSKSLTWPKTSVLLDKALKCLYKSEIQFLSFHKYFWIFNKRSYQKFWWFFRKKFVINYEKNVNNLHNLRNKLHNK